MFLPLAKSLLRSSHRAHFPRKWVLSVGVAFGATSLSFKLAHCDAIEKPVIEEILAQPKILQEAAVVVKPPKVRGVEMTSWELLKEIATLLKPDWLLVILVIGVTALSGAIAVYTPLALGNIVTIVQKLIQENSLNLAALNGPAVQLMSLFGAQGMVTFLDIALVTHLGENVATRLRNRLFKSLLAQDIAFFDTHMHGELIQRLSGDVADFKHTFKVCVTKGLKSVSQIVGSTVTLYTLSPSLTLSLLGTMPVAYLAMNFYGSFLRILSKNARIGDSEAAGVAAESLSNIRTVRSFATEDLEFDRHCEKTNASSKLNRALGFHIGLFQGLTTISVGGLVLMVLYVGGQLVAKKEMTGGELMAYMVSTQAAQRAFATVGELFGQVVKASGAASRVFEYIRIPALIPIQGGYIPPYILGKLEFRNITFAYPSRPDQNVVEDFNLVIPKGTVVALCGKSGTGKSTLGQLIERFYDPNAGEVLLDGLNIKDLDPKWLRNHIGYIHQEPILFATSVYENIRYGRPEASREDVLKAAQEANAFDFISGFPQGFDTVVGERGVTLSGGQKQRIAIARALLKDPQILILDEATSALDTESERIVQDALERLMKGRTVLIIAHRLTTIQSADLIVVMNKFVGKPSGGIAEMGTHGELMNKKGVYFNLYTQSGFE